MNSERTHPVPVTESRALFFRSKDVTSRFEAGLEEGTVRISRAVIAGPHQTAKQNVNHHIRNIFENGRFQPDVVVKEYVTTAADGKQYQKRNDNPGMIRAI